jgi:flagellar biosynthesis regulator FlaF
VLLLANQEIFRLTDDQQKLKKKFEVEKRELQGLYVIEKELAILNAKRAMQADIASNIKEVQTDKEMLEKFIDDYERAKRLEVGMSLKSRILKMPYDDKYI